MSWLFAYFSASHSSIAGDAPLRLLPPRQHEPLASSSTSSSGDASTGAGDGSGAGRIGRIGISTGSGEKGIVRVAVLLDGDADYVRPRLLLTRRPC